MYKTWTSYPFSDDKTRYKETEAPHFDNLSSKPLTAPGMYTSVTPVLCTHQLFDEEKKVS